MSAGRTEPLQLTSNTTRGTTLFRVGYTLRHERRPSMPWEQWPSESLYEVGLMSKRHWETSG